MDNRTLSDFMPLKIGELAEALRDATVGGIPVEDPTRKTTAAVVVPQQPDPAKEDTMTAAQLCEIRDSYERNRWAYLRRGEWYVPTGAELAEMSRDERKVVPELQTQFLRKF
jgi:hypothetical protein